MLAVVLLSVGGLGVGLFTAREAITVAVMETVGPGVDLDYCVSNSRQATIEYRIAEAIKTGAISPAVRNSEDVQKSSQALRELLGIDLEQVTLLRASFSQAVFAGNSQSGVVVIQSSQRLKRPAAAVFTQHGVKCFRLKATTSKLPGSDSDTMFFANSTTAVVAKEKSVRMMIDRWKEADQKQGELPAEPPSLLRIVFEQPAADQLLLPGSTRFAVANLKDFSKLIITPIDIQSCSLSARGGTALTWEVAVHPRVVIALNNSSSAVEGLRSKFETLRTEITKIQSSQKGMGGGAQQTESSHLTLVPRVDSNRLVFTLPKVPEANKNLTSDLLKTFQFLKQDTGGTPSEAKPIASGAE